MTASQTGHSCHVFNVAGVPSLNRNSQASHHTEQQSSKPTRCSFAAALGCPGEGFPAPPPPGRQIRRSQSLQWWAAPGSWTPPVCAPALTDMHWQQM